MNTNQPSLNLNVLMNISTALVVGLVLLMFASRDEGLDDGISVVGATGRFRVIGERNAERGGADLAELVANEARQDASTPRVDVSDQAILGKSPVDSPKSLMSDDVESSSLTKE